MTDTFRFVKETPDAWVYEGLAIPYGGVTRAGQDLTGSHFTKDTDLCLDWFPNDGRPVLYRHGFDTKVKASPVGRELGTVREDDKGRWVQLQIEKAKEYAAEVKQLADEGVLALSSGAVDHLAKIAAKTGAIEQWPWVELSLVPNPANPEALVYRVKSVDAIEHIRIVGTDEPAALTEAPAAKAYDPAADHAATGAGILGSLLWLISCEAGEADQVALLQSAADSLSEWITAERGEIGTAEGDESMTDAYLSMDHRPAAKAEPGSVQSIHDAACSLGAACDATKAASPAPRLVITDGHRAAPEPPDLTALAADLADHATKEAKRLLGLI